MTEFEIEQIVSGSEETLRSEGIIGPVVLWILAGYFLVSGVLVQTFLASYLGLVGLIISFGLGTSAVYFHYMKRKYVRDFEKNKAQRIWQQLVDSGAFGSPLIETASGLNKKIQDIYADDPNGRLLPLAQAIRLFNVYCRQHERYRLLDKRADILRFDREELIRKRDRLNELGEERIISRELERFNGEIEVLEAMIYEVAQSYRRLESVIVSVSHRAEANRLQNELDELTARLPQATEPAFAPESLEEIERQIRREIETYLQLERETEEHLW